MKVPAQDTGIGSRWPEVNVSRLPKPDEMDVPAIQVEAPAGSLLVYESRIWHQTGEFTAKAGVRASDEHQTAGAGKAPATRNLSNS